MIRKIPRQAPILGAAALAAATLLAAGASQAAQVFSDNFNSENGGVGADPYSGYANFTVLQGATTLNVGARCAGGSGGCVGLDGRGDTVGTEFETTLASTTMSAA